MDLSHFNVHSYLERERTRVDAALGSAVDWLLQDAPAPIAEPIRYAVESGGKRLRPVYCLAAARAAGGDADATGALDVAGAVELIHTYSLIHDDLPSMDDDALRRGRPTVHVVYGIRAAALAGAAMLPLAFRLLQRGAGRLGLGGVVCGHMTRALASAAGAQGMVGGQWLDLAAEGMPIELDQLEAIHAAKTAALLAASLELGGHVAGASDRSLGALRAYGRAVGLAFQVADDVLDVTAETTARGKTAGRDAALGKATFPGLLGLAAARERAEFEVDSAVAALAAAGLDTLELRALARFAIERER